MKKTLIFIITAICSTFLLSCFIVKADDISVGVSPSFFNGVEISPGLNKDIYLNVVNTSKCANNETSINNCTYNIELTATDSTGDKFNSMSKEEQIIYRPCKWVSFENNMFPLKPGESKKVKINIKVPSNATSTEYPIYINVKQSINGSDVNNSGKVVISTKVQSFIEVPVYVVAGKVNSKTEYEILGFDVTDKTEENSVVSMIKGLISFDKNKWNEFLYKPYKINKNGKILYDIPYHDKRSFKEVSTCDSKKLSNSKYILLDNRLKDSCKISNIKFDGIEMIVSSNNENFKIKLPNAIVCDNIQSQINNIATGIGGIPTWGYLVDKIKLDKSLYVANTGMYTTYKIKNKGNTTIVPNGVIDVFDQNNKKVDSAVYGYTIIRPGETKDVIAQLSYDPSIYKEGEYLVRSNIFIDKDSETISKTATVCMKSIRTKVLFIVASIILVTLVLLLVLIIFIIKRRNKKKKYGGSLNEENNIHCNSNDCCNSDSLQ